MSDFKVIETQEELDRIIGERLARQKEKFADYDELKSLNSRLEAEKIQLNEALQLSQSAKEELETKVSRYESDKLKTSVALSYGLPLEFAERLQGSDEASLRSDAEKWSGLFKANGSEPILKDVEPTLIDGNDAMWRQVVRGLK